MTEETDNLSEVIASLPTENCSVILGSGHVLHGQPESVTDEKELQLRTGDRLVFVPTDHITNIGPLHTDVSAQTPEGLSHPALGTALIQTTITRAAELEYHVQEAGDLLAGGPGFGSFEVAEFDPAPTPTFTDDQIVYLDDDYLREWIESNSGWKDMLENLTLSTPTWLGVQASYDFEGIAESDLTTYLDNQEPVPIDDVLDHEEPLISGYLELLEQDGEYVRRELNHEEWIAGIVTPSTEVPDISESPVIVAWFRPSSIWLEVGQAEVLDQIDVLLQIRGTPVEWEIDISEETSDSTVTVNQNIKVRAARIPAESEISTEDR